MPLISSPNTSVCVEILPLAYYFIYLASILTIKYLLNIYHVLDTLC